MASDGPPRDSPSQILTALSDRRCRAILGATAAASLSIAELAEQCDIPTSTTYRKVNLLEDAGLLEEIPQVDPNGPNASRYGLQTEEIDVTIAPADGGAISVTYSIDARDNTRAHSTPTDSVPIRISPDGGTESTNTATDGR